jgi:hypothetical protein
VLAAERSGVAFHAARIMLALALPLFGPHIEAMVDLDEHQGEPGRHGGTERAHFLATEEQVVAEEPSFVVLESGQIRFFVRPRVEVRTVESFADVQGFWVTLAPRNRSVARRVAVGKKRLPDDQVRERQWAYVDRVGSAVDIVDDLGSKVYATKTRGMRHQSAVIELARGRYAIASHRDHTHLLYELDSRDQACPGERRWQLRRQLNLVSRASYVAAIFNPEKKRSLDPRSNEEAPFAEPSMYDDDLMARFGTRRFSPLIPEFLDYEGTELVLMGGGSARALDGSIPPQSGLRTRDPHP